MLKIVTGDDLTEEIYLKTWELDNQIFEEKDRLTKEDALDWFYRSGKTTIVLLDDDDNDVIGYITPYLVNHSFANHYIISGDHYKEALKKDVFVHPSGEVDADIYLFSVAIKEEYRDKSLINDKPAIKILTDA